MWTANVIDVTFKQGVLRVRFEFSNGNDTILEERALNSLQSVKQFAISRVSELNSLENASVEILLGPVDLTSIDTVPTQEEQDKISFLTDYLKLQKIRSVVNLGVIPETNTEYLELLDKVKASYKQEYL